MKLKISTFLLSCVSLLLTTATIAQTTVLGYFPSYRSTSVVRYDKLTDIVFSFINSETNGNLITTNTGALWGFDYNKFVTIKAGCQTNAVNLWVGLGGADDNEYRSARLESVCSNSTYRAELISDLIAFAATHGLYGIALDWEFPKTQSARDAHEDLVKDLRTAINASANPNLKVACAVGGEYKNSVNHLQYINTAVISDASLIDSWHLMAYDFPTSYNVNHSSYTDADNCIKEWNQAKGVPYSKMLLGVPFYGRNSWSEIEYNNLGGTASVNYTADSYGGYYYNGKTTLENKMDLISGYGGQGILIWDLGQDRAAGDYSLLDAIDAKAATLCLVPKPNMGADRGVCSGQSTTLDPGVSTASGRSFVWYKDNVVMNGETGATVSVNTAATYKVAITQSGCTREDEIVIVTGSSVTTTGAAGCNNVDLTVSVNSPDGAKTYKWYDQASSGTLLHTGTSYTATFPTSTTVYVEEAAAGVTSYTTSPSTIPSGKFHAWAGTQYTKRCAQKLNVKTDLTIKSLRAMISAKEGATFNVEVVNANNKTAVTSAGPFTMAGDGSSPTWTATYFDFDANIALTPGQYLIYLEPSANDTGNYGIINGHTEEHDEAGVFTLLGSTFQNQSTDPSGFALTDSGQSWWSAHGPFINWVIETGANASCGRTATAVDVVTCGPPSVTINNPTANQNFFVTNTVNFDADITDEGTVSTVTFEIFNGATLYKTLTVNSSGSNYSSSWVADAPATYTLKVTATDNDNNTTVETVDFVVNLDVSTGVEINAENVKVFPVPSTKDFTVQVSDVSNFNVLVYDLNGKVVEQVNNINQGSAKFGAELTVGTYMLSIVSGNSVYRTTIVKK